MKIPIKCVSVVLGKNPLKVKSITQWFLITPKVWELKNYACILERMRHDAYIMVWSWSSSCGYNSLVGSVNTLSHTTHVWFMPL